MKIFFLIAILFISFKALSCEVILPSKIIFLNQDGELNRYAEARNCSTDLSHKIHQVLSGLEGKITSFHLQNLILPGEQSLTIKPQVIHVSQFKNLMREQVNLPSSVQLKQARLSDNSSVIAMNNFDETFIDCNHCLWGSNQNINLTIKQFDGSKRSVLVQADFYHKTKAIRTLSGLQAFSDFKDPASFKEEFIETIPHTDLISSFNELRFYKTNKPIPAGNIIKKSDLTPVNLVRAGNKTEVILENKMVKIKTQGISRSNGAFGEMVEVFHPQKNKKYLGRVIEMNKVMVDL